MTSKPTIGLALIARDEEDVLPRLLASIEGAFDQVVLVDSGSEDDTVGIFERWAAAGGLPLGYKIDRIVWPDDFAAARNHADGMLDTDWLSWADCDDWVVGAEGLRDAAALADRQGMKAFQFDYERLGSHGLNLRVRLLRRGAGRWQGRVHEGHDLFGLSSDAELGQPPASGMALIRWVTDRSSGRLTSLDRNRRILRGWTEDEPNDPTPVALLAPMELLTGDVETGMALFERYLTGDRTRSRQELKLARWGLDDVRRLIEGGLFEYADWPQIVLRPYVSLILGRAPGWMATWDSVPWEDR